MPGYRCKTSATTSLTIQPNKPFMVGRATIPFPSTKMARAFFSANRRLMHGSCRPLASQSMTFTMKRVRLSYVKTTKRAISEKEMRAIATLQLPEGTSIAFARDVFMFSFYMRGMPFVDIAYLRKKDLKNKMLAYSRKKTNQYLTVEWVKEAQEIIDRYEQINPASPYLLPIIQQDDGTEQKQYHRMLENINYNLKKIGEMTGLKMPLTTYTARHTWASIARDMDIPIPIISEGMGHNSIKTTQVYLNSIDVSKINEANKKIIRKISKKNV